MRLVWAVLLTIIALHAAFAESGLLPAGRINIGQSAGFPAAKAISGDATLAASGALTVTKTNGVSFATSATIDATNASNLISGTVPAARGGAGTINGALKGNGSGVVSKAATADLSDVATGAVTPTDASGASLTFTSVSAKYDRVGDVIFAFVSFVYPVTASGASASISLGGLPANFPASGYGRQCTITFNSGATPAAWALPAVSSSTVSFFAASGSAVTNANLSASNMILSCTYPAT